MDLQVKWSQTLKRWQFSTNGGSTWTSLAADNPEDSSEAIEDAYDATGYETSQWDLVEE